MSLKRLLAAFIVVTFILAGTVTITALLLNQMTQRVEQAQNRRFTSYQLAEELLRSSEMLTRFARTYVATGEERYREYYNVILDIRNGKTKRPDDYGPSYWTLVADSIAQLPDRNIPGKSLDERMQEAGITVKEFALLREGQIKSDGLVRTEDEAMDLVKGLIASGNPSWKSHPDHIKAIEMLHGREYHRIKATIMQPVAGFLDLLSQRCNEELLLLNQRSDLLLVTLISSSIMMLLAFSGFAFLLYRQLIVRGSKLLRSVKDITEGKLDTRILDGSSDELGRLSNAIDNMTEKLATALKSTRQELKESQATAEEISVQKEHSEKLLHNMLPVLIADRLKRGESQIAETFPEVTVLFADIVGFTELSTSMPPRQLVNILNDIFGGFDELADKFRLEKIKTIGDCYMVVGGVPDRSPTHCQQVADFAIEAVRNIREYSARTGLKITIRIGMHTGTVVAGVVGKSKYSYDLWGDVVNTASRLESSSGPDHIHVTEAVKIRLHDDYDFDPRGLVDLKGKGQIATFFLLGKKAGH